MLKIKIISVGKTKEAWLEEAIDEYVKRLQNTLSFEFLYVKTDEQLLALVEKEGGNVSCSRSERTNNGAGKAFHNSSSRSLRPKDLGYRS